MNFIYENSLLTIIAAEGVDASAGYPGPFLELVVVVVVPHSLAALDQSKWASRAWMHLEKVEAYSDMRIKPVWFCFVLSTVLYFSELKK